MKKILTWFGYLLLCVSVCSFVSYAVEDRVDVEIKIDGDRQVYNHTFDTNVEVKFYNKELYHEGLLLSYHVYDADGTLLEYENQRVPMFVETDSFHCPLKIDVSSLNDSSNMKKFVIKFDIVDVQNMYWYSDADLKMKADVIYVEQNALKAFQSGILKPIGRHPYIFAVNCICLLAFVAVVVRYRKIFQ